MKKNIPLVISIILNALLLIFIFLIFWAPASWFIPTDYLVLQSSGGRYCHFLKNLKDTQSAEDKQNFDDFCKNLEN